MEHDFITINFAATLGIIFLVLFLRQNGRMEKTTKTQFFMLIILEFIEMAVYSAELMTASFANPTIYRTIYSIIGYIIRPLLVYIILMISLRADLNATKKRVLFIPELFNIVIVCTSLFSDIAFGYTKTNEFYRGELGYITHITLFFYILVLLVFTFRDTLKRKTFEQAIIYLMSVVIIGSVVIEAVFSVRSIGRTATVMCTVFYYMYFQTQEYEVELQKGNLQIQGLNTRVNYDPMTQLLNKEAFRNDCLESFAKNQIDNIAFLFLDMDHFKRVNDTLGHLTGDKAIIDTAMQLKQAFRDNDLVSRFGGDEFCACLRGITYEELSIKLEYICKILRQEYWNDNHTDSVNITCSIGAVYYDGFVAVDYENLIVTADRVVYKAKNSGRDRAIIEKL